LKGTWFVDTTCFSSSSSFARAANANQCENLSKQWMEIKSMKRSVVENVAEQVDTSRNCNQKKGKER